MGRHALLAMEYQTESVFFPLTTVNCRCTRSNRKPNHNAVRCERAFRSLQLYWNCRVLNANASFASRKIASVLIGVRQIGVR
ncbi:hypothetical protein BV898_16469 [Hypsibius exemplaris]|uniref:Uncharacterized protein n=1 Tax=Hypsibius exemplaris TaxID=2072580 RepID=A0A9X6NFY5_HYPEX|nr:hypothetical protein BV898_16469 [Hypsibius exemplaris]